MTKWIAFLVWFLATAALSPATAQEPDVTALINAFESDQIEVYGLFPSRHQYEDTKCYRVEAGTSTQDGFSYTAANGQEWDINRTGEITVRSEQRIAEELRPGTPSSALKTVTTAFEIGDVRQSEGVPYLWTIEYAESTCILEEYKQSGRRNCLLREAPGDVMGAFILTQEIASSIDAVCG